MKLHALDIPEDARQLPAWLERHLMQLDLSALAAELAVVHAPRADAKLALEDLLGAQHHAVMESGLSALSTTTLAELIVQPRLLLELQTEVLTAGGPYWDNVVSDTEMHGSPGEAAALVASGRKRLEAYLEVDGPRRTADDVRVAAAGRAAWHAHPALVSMVTAACVLLGVFAFTKLEPPPPEVGQPPEVVVVPPPVGWGWSHPDALPQDVAPDEYLRQLAQGAGAWFNKRPDDPAGLAKRIGQFRQGCSIVMLAEHTPLAEADRAWLLERCRLWAGNLDRHLADIESPRADFAQVRDAADTTINKLIAALNQRATEVAAA